MKKMMRIAAASLCLALAITTLSACSSTENNKPAEEPSKPGEVVTTTEPTLAIDGESYAWTGKKYVSFWQQRILSAGYTSKAYLFREHS